MNRFAAFLRGMNIGGRRVQNAELCAAFESLGFCEVRAFLASGNVIFESEADDQASVARTIEAGLFRTFDYPVPTTLRSGQELATIVSKGAFSGEFGAAGGKPQVVLLNASPLPSVRREVLELASDADRLAFGERELYWLPETGVSTSTLEFRRIEKLIGPTTTRTRGTLERLAAKFFH